MEQPSTVSEVGELDSNEPYPYLQLPPRSEVGLRIEMETTLNEIWPDSYSLDHHGPNINGELTTSETPSAAEQALDLPLMPFGKLILCTHIDSDVAAAIAVYSMRARKIQFNVNLVKEIGKVDRLGPMALVGSPYANEVKILQTICGRRGVPLPNKVAFTRRLLTGKISDEEKNTLLNEYNSFLERAMNNSTIVLQEPLFVAITSTVPGIVTYGYTLAETVIAFNPEMKMGVSEDGKTMGTYAKYTIARRSDHVNTDIPKILEVLNTLENNKRIQLELEPLKKGWGGRDLIIGSPEYISSVLTLEEIITAIRPYIKENLKLLP